MTDAKKLSDDLDDLGELIKARMVELDAALLDRDNWRNEARILRKQNERLSSVSKASLEERLEDVEKKSQERRDKNNLDRFTYVITLTLENLRSLSFYYTLTRDNISIAGGRHTLDKIWSALIEHHIRDDIERHK